MTQVVVVGEAGNKRRLPSWMVQVNAADKVRESGNADEKRCLSEEQLNTQSAGSKIRPAIKEHDKTLSRDFDTRHESETFQGCQRKKRAPSKLITSCGGAKKKLKKETTGDRKRIYENVASERQLGKSKRCQNDNVKILSPERSDEEIELTIEDLMTIAKEYVSDARENQYVNPASRESTSKLNTLRSSGSSEAEFQANGSSQILSKCSANKCSSHLKEFEGKDKDISGVEYSATNIKRTGDTAQDMLDLFLGPLLRKPPSKERGYGAVESERLLSISNSDKQVGNSLLLNEEVPMVKKKSSLKDKVAMFLE